MTDRSVGFDRAADYYDRTRGFSAEAFDELLTVLVSDLGGRGRCLEIGVGTGLLALPLSEAGVAMVGADLARPMLEKLVQKAGGRTPFPLVRADATALPFRDASLGCAVVRHVLHLIPRWAMAVSELARVLRPGGRIVTIDGPFSDAGWELVHRFLSEAGGVPFAVGLQPEDEETLAAEISAHGGRLGNVTTIAETDPVTVGQFLDQMERGMHSWTWRVDEATRRRAVASVRVWAEERFGSLGSAVADRSRITVRRYDLPGEHSAAQR